MKANPRIFVVDDDPSWLEVLNRMLRKIGYDNIRSFTTGADCLQNLQQNPKVIFLDYQMDDMDGLQVLWEIKKYNPFTNVIFCTAHNNIELAVSAIKYGSAEFLLKENISIKKISDALESLMGEQGAVNKGY